MSGKGLYPYIFGHTFLPVARIRRGMIPADHHAVKNGKPEEKRTDDRIIAWEEEDAIDALTSEHCLRTDMEKLKESVKSKIPKTSIDDDSLI